jgi:hypothetical protein
VSAGLPGAGLAGLFFILSAILAVPIELVRTVRGRSSRQAWLGVGRHVGLAVAMIMALEFAFAAVSAVTADVAGKRVLPTVMPHVPVLLTLAVLVTVLATTKALELALRRRHRGGDPAGAPDRPMNTGMPVESRMRVNAHVRFGGRRRRDRQPKG